MWKMFDNKLYFESLTRLDATLMQVWSLVSLTKLLYLTSLEGERLINPFRSTRCHYHLWSRC